MRPLVAANDGAVLAVACDISDPGAVAAAHAQVVGALGEVDVLVNNAGILSTTRSRRPASSSGAGVLGANLDGAMFWARRWCRR